MKAWMLLFLLWGVGVSVFSAVVVQQQSKSDMTISFKLPDYTLDNNDKFSKVFCPDLAGHPGKGYPDLPYQECKIAVPSNGNVQITVISSQVDRQSLKLPIEPVPTIVRGSETDNYNYVINTDAYNLQRSELFTVSPVQFYRNRSFVTLRIYPFSYQHSNMELTINRSITFQAHITGDINQKINITDKLQDSFFKEMLNGGSAQYWGSGVVPDIKYADFSISDHWYSFEAAADGVYAITYDQLSAVLNITDVIPDSIRIFTTGGQVMSARSNDGGLAFQEIPLLIDAGNDSSFDIGDRIIFYGQDRDEYSQNYPIIQDVNPAWFYAPIYFNPYSQNVKYWLTYARTTNYNTAPLRIDTESSSGTASVVRNSHPEVLKLESDRLKIEPNPIGFHMFQALLAGSSTATYSYNFNLENADLSKQQKITTTLEEQPISGSPPNHAMGLSVNQNSVVQNFTWSENTYATITRTGNFCVNGSNQIQLTIYRTNSDNILLDYFRIEYEKLLVKIAQQPYRVNVYTTDYDRDVRYEFTSANTTPARIYKVTGFNQVSLLSSEVIPNGFAFQAAGDANTRIYALQEGDYLNVSNLRAEIPVDLTVQLQPVDNLIITPAEFKPQADQLKMYYEEQLNVASKVVNVQDIYNQFNAGMPDPSAIRQFIRYCFYKYPAPALTSITLFGVGTNDWRNQTGEAAGKNKLIVFQKVLEYTSEITSDDYFVMLSPGNASYPELAVGRYVARTTAEMELLLNRVVEYGTVPNPGWWRSKLAFFADDDVNGSQTGEWIHSQYMEQGSQVVSRSVLVDKIFAIDYDFDEFGNKPQARDDMIAQVNEGRLAWYYNGHGSYDKLGSEDYFSGFSDMSRLTNSDHLTLFLAASCDVGEFDSYSFDCLAEKLTYYPNGGAIASFASTRECFAQENSALMNFLFERIMNQGKTLGEGIRLAKFTSGSVDNDATYVLLGDPLLSVNPPLKNTTMTINAVNNRLQARQTALLTGNFDNPALNGTVEMRTYDSDLRYRMPNNAIYTKNNNPIFKGTLNLNQGVYNGGFVVPDDIVGGNTARIITYLFDAQSGKDYVNCYAPLNLSGHDFVADNPDSPNVRLFLETMAFRAGDQVSTNPVLYANISDSTGINVLGSAGHKILLILDNGNQPIDVTDNFFYNTDSYTTGTLTFQLPEVAEGVHTLQLIVFDNFNRPTVAETNFIAKNDGSLTILKMLPYPNPMKKDGMFTLVLNDSGQMNLSIYTITGKKIRTIKQDGQRGYNQISWDGKDDDGDYLANNTYLYKVKVKNGSKNAEKTGQFIIYH